MIENNIENNIENDIVKDCPLLFRLYGKSPSKSCLAYGFECNEGWHSAIASACRELETYNNLIYPKYGVYIQADQIKEKFGTLRFYYSIIIDGNKYVSAICDKLNNIADWLSYNSKFNYRFKRVVDVEPYDYTKDYFLSKEDYEAEKAAKVKASNVTLKEDDDGNYIKSVQLRNYGKYHYEPTRLKFVWMIKNVCEKTSNFLHGYLTTPKYSAATNNAYEFLERKASKIIRRLEDECMDICEFCGRHIGTKYSPRCQTTGWIKYICDDCAEKSERNYYKNGELWNKTTMLKSKEDLEKDEEPPKLMEET